MVNSYYEFNDLGVHHTTDIDKNNGYTSYIQLLLPPCIYIITYVLAYEIPVPDNAFCVFTARHVENERFFFFIILVRARNILINLMFFFGDFIINLLDIIFFTAVC